ncbi:MAG TPA: glycerophosphodiester phosphodiesterase family protein, partial [Ilumatobacteraceae bacterium]|nr:glycerophosphodiester phosphodiesterase family protein [Ilumatobacteraceae bacterium]
MIKASSAVLVGMLAALTACGQSGSPSSDPTPVTVAPTSAVAPTTAPQVSVAPTPAPPVTLDLGSSTTSTATTALSHASSIAALLKLDRPLVIAHTGGEDEYPGSTMFAFAESVKAGADMLDLNVLLSADGVLVIQHDETVNRTSNGSGDVASMTAAQLGALDNAYWFTAEGITTDAPPPSYLYRGIRTGEVPPPAGYTADDFAIPTLDALIDRFPGVPLGIEIKGSGEPALRAADVLLTTLRDRNLLANTVDQLVRR